MDIHPVGIHIFNITRQTAELAISLSLPVELNEQRDGRFWIKILPVNMQSTFEHLYSAQNEDGFTPELQVLYEYMAENCLVIAPE